MERAVRGNVVGIEKHDGAEAWGTLTGVRQATARVAKILGVGAFDLPKGGPKSGVQVMRTPFRVAFASSCLFVSAQLPAATELALVRSGVGVVGRPMQLDGRLDVNGNGRPELLVAGRTHASIVEEDTGPRGYREVARLEGPGGSLFQGAMLVDVPGAGNALLLRWAQRLELRDAATLRIKAIRPGISGATALGDVDGDGFPEIVASNINVVELLDPATLESRGSLALSTETLAVANILGDQRAEIVSDQARAYTVARSGGVLSWSEVWNAGISGTWTPYVVDVDGRPAIVLHDSFAFSAQLATFSPAPSLRVLVPPVGPAFVPRFADVNGDGRVDLIAATSNEVRALDIGSGSTFWTRNTLQPPRLGLVSSPVVADLDNDGIIEMAWADELSDSGVIAVSVPPTGPPRWRSDSNQSRVADWTVARNTQGGLSVAYLSLPTRELPRLGTIGFIDGSTLTDRNGSAFSWLPGYTGIGPTKHQFAIAALPRASMADAVIVSGAEYPLFGGNPLARWLWTFDSNGALLSERAVMSSVTPERIVVAQVLDRPERQIIVAGRMPSPASGMPAPHARVEVVDYATGNLLWQSAMLPTYDGAPMTALQVVDVDGDGVHEIVFAYGVKVAVLRPSSGPQVVREYAAQQFSVFDRGVGRGVMIATLDGAAVALYDALSAMPERTFTLPAAAYCVALSPDALGQNLLIATSNYQGTSLRRVADGQVVASRMEFQNLDLVAVDIDGDRQMELLGSDLNIWRVDSGDWVFRDGFEAFAP